MALTTPYHYRNLSKVNLARLISFDECTSLLFDPPSFFDANINLAVNLVRKVSDSCLMGKEWIHLLIFIIHHRLVASVYLTKFHLVADILILLLCAWEILFIHTHNIALVLFNAVSNHVLNKTIEGLYLLVNNSVLFEVCIYYLPLIVNIYLVLTIFVYIGLVIILVMGLSKTSWTSISFYLVSGNIIVYA